MKTSYVRNGVLPILIASCMWSGVYFTRKYLLPFISPLAITALISATVTIYMWLQYRFDLKVTWQHFRAHAGLFIGLSVSGVLLGTTLMMLGLSHLDLGIATLLEKLQPLFTLWMAALFLKERLPRRLLPFCALALLSAYVISTPNPLALNFSHNDIIGIAAIVGAAFCWGISSVIGRKLAVNNIPAPEITFLRCGITAVLSLPILFFKDALALHMDFTPLNWLLIISTAVVGSGYGYVLYYRGLKHVDAPTAGFLELATPICSLALGIVFLHERLSLTQWAAIPVLLVSVWKIAAAPQKSPVVEKAAELP